MSPEYFQRLARYNRWANGRLYDACEAIDDRDYRKDRGAFFGSLHGTLNHILVADRLWLSRITGAKAEIHSLDQILFDTLPALRTARAAEDARIVDLIDGLGDDGLDGFLHYKTMAGAPQQTRRDMVWAHIFNHQTHHRGQAHSLLSQAGGDPPELDLIIFLRDA